MKNSLNQRSIIIGVLVSFILSCENRNKIKQPKMKTYYKNGNIETIFSLDKQGKVHGEAFSYTNKGKLEMVGLFYHGKEAIIKRFKSKKIKDQYSFFVHDSLINVYVKFDEKGNIDKEKSDYANIKYVNKQKNLLSIELPGFYTDSIAVFFRKTFWDREQNKNNYLRRISYIKLTEPKIIVKIKDEDYYKGRLNIHVISYDKLGSQTQPKNSDFKIYFAPAAKEMLIQLDKGEIPKKYNLDPIW